MHHPDLSCALGNESWEPFVAQHQTPLTLDHSCRAIDVIRQRGGGGGAGSQEGAGGRTQPRAISSASLCSVSRAVSSGVSWVPDSDAWGPERKASRVRSKTGRPRSIRTSAAMFHSWLGCFWPASSNRSRAWQGCGLKPLGQGGAWRSRHQPCSFRMPFQLDVQREHPGPFVEADRLFGDPGGWGAR